jgi:acetolactate synthase-1/2/3 large subunit
VFSDGELSQISQAQQIPYNRKTCTVLGQIDAEGMAQATSAAFHRIERSADCAYVVAAALEQARTERRPVIVDVRIDYGKRTRFTAGTVATNLKRFDTATKLRFIGRALVRRVTG